MRELLADVVDVEEVLRAGDQFVRSRPELFTREAVFIARLKEGRVWTDGLRCRVVVTYLGVMSVYQAATGELLGKCEPGMPLVPAARKRGTKGRRA